MSDNAPTTPISPSLSQIAAALAPLSTALHAHYVLALQSAQRHDSGLYGDASWRIREALDILNKLIDRQSPKAAAAAADLANDEGPQLPWD